jgi:hypothetical protein
VALTHTNPPAAPAPQEHTMEEIYAAARSADYANKANATNAEAPPSPVSLAIRNLRDEISEVHYHADSLINSISPALRAVAPANQESKARPSMASELAEDIQQLADVLRTARQKLVDARERLTL